MLQRDHYEMFSSLQKDDFFAPCSALCNVPLQCKLQISVAMGPLVEWEVMKILLCSLVILSSRIHSAKTETAPARAFPQIKMHMEGFFPYSVVDQLFSLWIMPFFSSLVVMCFSSSSTAQWSQFIPTQLPSATCSAFTCIFFQPGSRNTWSWRRNYRL